MGEREEPGPRLVRPDRVRASEPADPAWGQARYPCLPGMHAGGRFTAVPRWRYTIEKEHALKKSALFTGLTALILTGCGEDSQTMTWDGVPRDPCQREYFNEHECREAIDNKGYHYGGSFHPIVYGYAYAYYHAAWRAHLAGGRSSTAMPSKFYSPDFVAPAIGAKVSVPVSRGGFGASFFRASS